MALQRYRESRASRRIRLEGRRKSGADAPARRCGAGRRAGAGAQHHKCDAGVFRRKREAARGGEVQRLRLLPEFDQRGAEDRATHRLFPCPQHVGRVADIDQDQARRIEAELGEPGRIESARLHLGIALPDPENLPLPGRAQRQRGREPGGRRRVGRHAGEHLVQRAAREADRERRIEARGSEGEGGDAGGEACLGGQLSPQRRQICRCGAHFVPILFYNASGGGKSQAGPVLGSASV